MNEQAYRERMENKRHIRQYARGNEKSLEVDTRKVTHFGRLWHNMDGQQKRKFDNSLVIDYGTVHIRYT